MIMTACTNTNGIRGTLRTRGGCEDERLRQLCRRNPVYEHTAVLWAENQPHLIDRVHRFLAPRSGFCGRLTLPCEGSARLRHHNLGPLLPPCISCNVIMVAVRPGTYGHTSVDLAQRHAGVVSPALVQSTATPKAGWSNAAVRSFSVQANVVMVS